MDVVVRPLRGEPGIWSLHDRLGRKVGRIIKRASDRFEVHPDPEGPPYSADIKNSASLQEAMDKIARGTRGQCQLCESEDG